ncbi:hypothetical protein [Streptococcus agalactiae]|uniref:hypothetical protein n=1 Tax=Streptococcus agalactiae TaxID=1311 RepID=UPI0005DFEE27|nr:hypothetical protein [Streptococcus agalactiae]HES5738018.1 hypothetical protein [Streptococcus pyogenes]KAF1205461.1 hypothetical protein B8V46_06550 [Streptococcus agalactiae]KLL90571.1 hypothetical protein WA08_02425 [Streptococcus agalactiae]MCW1398455.1 hypothetical protein [Streptococcus agalactiae]MCW1638120.1 hypothetical protein [Streptococcus agalactiae]
MRTQQSSMVKLTKNMMVIDLMRTTGWSRERVLKALEWLEAEKTVQFSANGSLNLRIFEG